MHKKEKNLFTKINIKIALVILYVACVVTIAPLTHKLYQHIADGVSITTNEATLDNAPQGLINAYLLMVSFLKQCFEFGATLILFIMMVGYLFFHGPVAILEHYFPQKLQKKIKPWQGMIMSGELLSIIFGALVSLGSLLFAISAAVSQSYMVAVLATIIAAWGFYINKELLA